MLKRLWSDHRNACLLTLALLIIGIVVSPWVLLAAIVPIGWVILKDEGSRKDQPPGRTTTPYDIKSIKPLKGSALLDKVKELGDISKDDLVRSCGYVYIERGEERPDHAAFYEELLVAKGVWEKNKTHEDKPSTIPNKLKPKSDREAALAAVQADGFALEHVDKIWKSDPQIVLAALKSKSDATEVIKYADKSLMKNREFALAALEVDGFILELVDEIWKSDPQMVLAALKSFMGSDVLEFADQSLMKNREFALAAVKLDGGAMEDLDWRFRSDREIILTAVKTNGFVLSLASKDLTADREVVLNAIRTDPDAIEYVDPGLKAQLIKEGLIQEI